MKYIIRTLLFTILFTCSFITYSQAGAIRINQLGYYPTANKIAVIVYTKASTFEVVNVQDNTVEVKGNISSKVF